MAEDQSLRAFAIYHAGIAKRLFEMKGGVNMMFVAQDVSGEGHFIQAVTHNDDDKDVVAAQLRSFFQTANIIRYAMISEAWILKLSANEAVPETRPSQHPDRIESIEVMAYDRGPNHVGVSQQIVREGGKATVQPMDVREGPSTGRFANLLETKQ